MGIESDQLVYDYLSRVGDLAQQRQLPSGDRMRLVSTLRNEIDRQRAKFEQETPATVRRILGRFGSPEDVVDSVAGGTAYVLPPEPEAAVPTQRDRLFPGRGKRVPRPRRTAEPAAPEVPEPAPEPRPAAAPPHLAGMDEVGTHGDEPDWWRVEQGPLSGPGESIGGFVGGVEIPEILRRPRKEEPPEAEAEDEPESYEEDASGAEEASARPGWRRMLRPRRAEPAADAPGAAPLTNPLLLIAAALLVGGAVFGYWLALGAGWLLAYASRRLSRTEAKWAVLGMPGLTLLAGLVWLWGRQDGRWGAPIAEGAMGDAMSGLWPWLVRGAALSSAAFLVWRSQRGRRRG